MYNPKHSGPNYELENNLLQIYTARGRMADDGLCKIYGCGGKKEKVFCRKHLMAPQIDPYKFSDVISASPTVFYKQSKLDSDYQINNSLATALHCSSPLNQKSSKLVLSKLKKLQKRTFDHNSKFLEISRLVYRSYKPKWRKM